MPKPATYPTILDDLLRLNISKLKEWNYLNTEQYKQGAINWSRNGNEIASIGIKSYTNQIVPYIELNYNHNKEPRNYRIYLVSTPSNLGKGLIWYFLCPQTNTRCRKLYLMSGYFLHRNAFNGCMYESQIRTKYMRFLDSAYGTYFNLDNIYQQLHKKHFKKSYKGKPTKKYLRLMTQIQRAERVNSNDIERLMLS